MTRYNKHAVILGSARSGTSWLSENLAKPFRYRMLFEPEHDDNTPKGHLLTDKLFHNDKDVPKQASHYLHQVLKNRVDSDWIAQNSNRKYKMHLWPVIPKKFIVKFVRFNLAGSYIARDLSIPTVHIIRNPIDVVKSQKRVSFPWLLDFQYFLQQAELIEILKSEYNYDLSRINDKSETEKLVVRWCIENVIPLEHFAFTHENFHIVKHEDLRNDINVYKNLCEDLGLEAVDNIEVEYTKPSSKTHPKSTIHGGIDEREFLDENDLDLVRSLLKQFRQSLYEF